MLLNAFMVGVGGFCGSILRHLFSVWLPNSPGYISKATLTANLVGCLIIGTFTRWSESAEGFSPAVANMVSVGFVGGLTTFSALAYDSVVLAQSNRFEIAALNVLLNLGLGVGIIWATRSFF